ncbi:MAG TPA: TlpA disulfide reductase family protein [Pyrinomonadaceae bacterium]|nr:TlpA disulfide reductase family protein [Pyrinomonadaceae bacterium]
MRDLRATISSLKSEQSSTPGTRLPPLIAQDMSGQTVTIRFDDIQGPTLLYVFSPSCGWCKKNEDNISSLASQTGDSLRIIGLSLSPEGLIDYVAHRFPPVKVIKPDSRTITAYKLSGTPETILVSSEGVVLKVWKGAYGDSTQRELEEYFHVKLPGLRQTS